MYIYILTLICLHKVLVSRSYCFFVNGNQLYTCLHFEF